MKNFLLATLLCLFASCAVVNNTNSPEFIGICVMDEDSVPIKDIIVTVLNQTSDNYEITNAVSGMVILPLDFQDQYIYVGSTGYEGQMFQATDTVIFLKRIKLKKNENYY